MKQNKIFKNEEGFTLIEIIAVLVIMGILAAVAIPKFFDLQQRAREKALYTAVSEMKVRVNQHFANELLKGYVFAEITYGADSVDIGIGEDFSIQNWTPGGTSSTIISFDVLYPANSTPNKTYANTIVKPKSG